VVGFGAGRWYHEYARLPRQSTGPRDNDLDRLWWCSRKAGSDKELPPTLAPVQAITARFIYAPYLVPALNDAGEQRMRQLVGGKTALISDKVFRTCQLPLAMRL
jgi:hypothetical protein